MYDDEKLRKSAEDYLEAILKLENAGQGTRSIDVAGELGVSRPSVNKALGVLKKAGMIEQQPYGRISLTDGGRKQAVKISERHKIICEFLTKVLGVDQTAADADACKIEHELSPQTMEKLIDYFEKHANQSH